MELIKMSLIHGISIALIGAGIGAAILLIAAAIKVVKEDRKDDK